MANEIKIVIKAKNEVSPAVKAAQREIEELRQPLLRTRGIIVGLGQVLRGDFAGGFATMGRSAMGTFGTIIGKLGAIGAAFGAAFAVGTAIRNITGLGKWLDKLVVPAEQVFVSIRDMAKVQTAGLEKGLKDIAGNLNEVVRNAKAAGAAMEAMAEGRNALAEAEIEQKVKAFREANPQGGPIVEAQEQRLRAEAALPSRQRDVSTSEQQAKIAKDALAAVQDQIRKNEAAIRQYHKTEIEGTSKFHSIRKSARDNGLEDYQPVQDAARKYLADSLAATEAIKITEAAQVKLKEQELTLTTELENANTRIIKSKTEITKAQLDITQAVANEAKARADAQADIEKKAAEEAEKSIAASEKRIAAEEKIAAITEKVGEADLFARARDNLEKAESAAKSLHDELATREETVAGSKQFQQVMLNQKRRDKAEEALYKARAQAGLAPIQAAEAKTMTDQQISEQTRTAQILTRIGVRVGKGGVTEAATPEQIAAISAKRGRPLSQEEKEIVSRSNLIDRERSARQWEQIEKANLKGADIAKQAKDIADSLLELKKIQAGIAGLAPIV